MKKLFLLLLLFVSLNASAQVKYNYAIISYVPEFKELQISMSGQEFVKVPVANHQVKGDGDVSAALEEVIKLEDAGWELFNTEASNGVSYKSKVFTFYLRRKRAF